MNSKKLREELLHKIAEHDYSVNNLKSRPDHQHQDPTEFLESLYSNIFGNYKEDEILKPKNNTILLSKIMKINFLTNNNAG